MSLAKDLMQVGIPDQAAIRLGFQVASVTAAGTSSADATILLKSQTLVLVTVGASTPGVKLPADAELGVEYVIGAISATNAGLVYPPTGGQLNGDTVTTAGTPLNVRGTTRCIRVDSVNWVATVGAAG